MNSSTGFRLTLGIAVLSLVPLYFLLQHTPPAFAEFPAGDERKREFLAYLTPIVNEENKSILKEREAAYELAAAAPDLGFYKQMKLDRLLEKYSLEDFSPEKPEHWTELLKRIDEIPASLALAQAASESGWGTSRFAREGNNYFGQWCFESGCGLVPNNRGAGKTHEVAHFDSPADSVRAYLLNLNQHAAYKTLRDLRAHARKESGSVTGVHLARGLIKYSERGEAYVREIRSIITHNKLESAGL